MLARLMAFSVWLLLGGSVAYWSLQLFSRPLAMPASVLPAGESRATQVDLSRLLGVTAPDAAPQVDVAPSTRLRLVGVVAPRNAKAAEAGEGVALIEVDGVTRTVRVGAVVDGDLQLMRVDARSASLGVPGRVPTQVLEISPPATPATGSLPPAAPSPIVLGGNPAGAVAQQPAAAPTPAPGPGASPGPARPAAANGVPLAAPRPMPPQYDPRQAPQER